VRLDQPVRSEPEGLRFEAVDAEGFSRFCAGLQGWSDDVRVAFARRLRYSPLPQHRVIAWDSDEAVVAAMSMREDDWVGLFNVYVDAVAPAASAPPFALTDGSVGCRGGSTAPLAAQNQRAALAGISVSASKQQQTSSHFGWSLA
jgi:hypothetical protein